MVLAGDEIGRTQRGNNNAYCQDNEISWFDWSLVEKHADLVRFCQALIEFRRGEPAVRALRARQKRNFIATLLLSQGVPMLAAGDEIGRTQGGNNNAYCQDNPISWIDWTLTEERQELLEFVRRVIALRRAHPVFRRRQFFQGRPLYGSSVKDIVWLQPDGQEMTESQWNSDFARSLGVYLSGEALDDTDARGRPIDDESFLMLFNAYHEVVTFKLPVFDRAITWVVELDTGSLRGTSPGGVFSGGETFPLQGRSLVLLREREITP
jgi:glycogen operon protein